MSYRSAICLASWGWLLPVRSLMEFDAMVGGVGRIYYMMIMFEGRLEVKKEYAKFHMPRLSQHFALCRMYLKSWRYYYFTSTTHGIV